LNAGEMMAKGSRNRHVKSILNVVNSFGRGVEPAPTPFAFDAAGGDLARIVSQLTHDVERFDSMIRNQRHLLQHHDADLGAFDDRLIRRQSRRISAVAAEIVTRARGALEELRGLSNIGELVSLETLERHHGNGRAKDRPAG
jgi:hypothetical protein